MTRQWTAEELGDTFDEDEERDRVGPRILVAFLSDLGAKGVEVHGVQRDVDGEGEENLALALSVASGTLYVHFPGVPLEWLQRRGDHESDWQTWRAYNYSDAMFVQGYEYFDWDEAVQAAAERAASGDL
ncbi:hypothetical protein [Actinomadura violacea]|uniref:Uncharacterized protein n=1 Tax=Actinomadura violacea TaxID=2819934 RepID=A0ABS3RNN4_9ACTN|nr:hypothetical protein [Actinomadura violacea]MBO2458370.1 hypothetical protein [Actinomadura violacea]